MVLFVLLKRDLTMYAIKKHIQDLFAPFTNPSFGALKPALTKLEAKGLLSTSKMMSEGGKLSVFYSITQKMMTQSIFICAAIYYSMCCH